MLHELNLARRPFVDTRPANAAALLLAVTVVVLSAWSVRTVTAYLADSQATRDRVAALRDEIARYEAERKQAETGLSRFDLEGLAANATEANGLARLRTFSWTRFLTRLEEALPADVRVVSIGVDRSGPQAAGRTAAGSGPDEFRVTLSLVSQDPDGMPKLIRAFYGSPHFDQPVPLSEVGAGRGKGDGTDLAVAVVYRDDGGAR